MNTALHAIRACYVTRRGVVLVLFALGSVFLMAAQVYHEKFAYNDFSVYHLAAQRVLAGEDLYRPVEDGFYRYLYSPTGAMFFIPISFLPLPVAKVVYWYGLTGLVLVGLYGTFALISSDIRNEPPARVNTLLLLAGVILGVHIQREILLGQVNHILLVLYLGLIYAFANGRRILLAAIWSASLFIKPFGLIFLPYLVLRRRWADVGLCAAFAGLLFAAPLLFYSPAGYRVQLQGQMVEIEAELMEKQGMLDAGNHTVFSVLARYTPLKLVTFRPAVSAAYQAMVLAGVALVLAWMIRRGTGIERGYLLDFAVLTACIPLLAFTSYNAFGFGQVMVCLLLYRFGSLTRAERVVAVAGFALSGGNWYDLWGRRLWLAFESWSLLSIGTMLMIAVLWRQRCRQQM